MRGISRMDANQQQTVREWSRLIAEKVNTALGAKLDGDFVASNYPSGFPFGIKQQYYNKDSLATLDTLLRSNEGIYSLEDPFSTLYRNVINNTAYGFSTEDQNAMQQEQTSQMALVGKIIDAYKLSDLDENPDPYKSVQKIMVRIKEVTGNDYLHVDTRMYPHLATLCNLLSEFARKATITTKLQNQWVSADDRLKAVSEHIANPSEENGGLKTSNINWDIGWEKLPQTEQLLKSLQGESSISLSMEASNFEQRTSQLHIGNVANVRLPFAWLFMPTIEHKSTCDLSEYAQSGASMSVSIKYGGITLVSAIPTPLSANNKAGWLASDVLREVSQKSGKDSTGYQLNGSEFDPSKLFGRNGQLTRIKTFVIAQQPAITIRMFKFDYTRISKAFSEKTAVDLMLFGCIRIGGSENQYSVRSYKEDSSSQSLEVTLSPAPITSSGTIDKQTAFVLGGVAEWY